MGVQVFKFGGASVRNADGFRNVGRIIQQNGDKPLLVVISAMGKTTNALEQVVNAFYKNTGSWSELFEIVKKSHTDLFLELMPGANSLPEEIVQILQATEARLKMRSLEEYDLIYDQVVSAGELLSSRILAYYLHALSVDAEWIDIRDIILTDSTYRDARIMWQETKVHTEQHVKPLLEQRKIIVTQGFIGKNADGYTTTLGREGSDYTAAILSYCLDAESMHIWKDVPGVLTGDPRIFEEVTLLPRLSYNEAIEMTYYGAKVIHPKTIKPLQNKQIPLYVRPFDEPSSHGTVISAERELSYPPVIVIESNQSLLHISTNDFSFVAEHHLSSIFALLAQCRLKVNMMRNTAISFSVCVNNVPDRIAKFEKELGTEFKLIADNDLELITILHYNDAVYSEMKKDKLVLQEEKYADMVQIVARNIPKMKRRDIS